MLALEVISTYPENRDARELNGEPFCERRQEIADRRCAHQRVDAFDRDVQQRDETIALVTQQHSLLVRIVAIPLAHLRALAQTRFGIGGAGQTGFEIAEDIVALRVIALQRPDARGCGLELRGHRVALCLCRFELDLDGREIPLQPAFFRNRRFQLGRQGGRLRQRRVKACPDLMQLVLDRGSRIRFPVGALLSRRQRAFQVIAGLTRRREVPLQ